MELFTDAKTDRDSVMGKKKKWEIRKEKAEKMMLRAQEMVTGNDGLKRWLEFRAKFRTHSVSNTLLILAQNPLASLVKGYKQWQAVGRQVSKGERGMLLWVPYFKKARTEEEAKENNVRVGHKYLKGFGTSYVWDIDQTEEMEDFDGEPLTVPNLNPVPGNDLERVVGILRSLFDKRGYTYKELTGTLRNGHWNRKKKEVGVRTDGRSWNGIAKTLIHEMAHADAHDPDQVESGRNIEVEAEGAAYMTCLILGVDTSNYSLPYIWSHAQKKEEVIEKSLKEIDRISDGILEAIREEVAANEKDELLSLVE